MTRTRILIPLGAFLFAVGITVLAAILPWIPEWKLFQMITAILGITGAMVAMVMLLRGTWLQTRERMEEFFRMLLVLMLGVVLGGILFVLGMYSLFVMSGGFFGPRFAQKFEFPEYSTTIYVYDSSFFDPVTTFRMRRGFLPFASDMGKFEGYDPDHLEVVREGEWAVCEDFRVHLPSGMVGTRY